MFLLPVPMARSASTLVRPGPLTNDPGTGRVELKARLDRSGSIPREDVAAVLLATLDADNTIHKSLDVLSGDDGIAESLARL
ncbi:MAG: NAD(P)H-binding protein [Marinobacter sp.]